jgi:Multicopper oxidase
MAGGYQEAEIDFVVDNPGLTLFHCHQQLHMDFGFMTLFDYVVSEASLCLAALATRPPMLHNSCSYLLLFCPMSLAF